MSDLIFVTVDCWRADAPARMPRLESVTDGWHQGSTICAAAATNGVFPAIFASRFYPNVYGSDGSVPDVTRSLPSILGDNGYATGGFVASNPFVGKWSEHFDAWWNDGMSAGGVDENRHDRDNSLPRKLARFLQLRPYVPAEDVLARADEWWERTDGQRFLWVHLMEPHGPYLPGFHRGREIGLFRTYASIAGQAKLGDDRPDWMHRHLKRTHYQCVDRLDAVLGPWLERHDDATIVLTGDHGEEFDHGMIAHARLYDETVRVPLFVDDSVGSFAHGEFTRQLDLAPTILDHLDIDVPDAWEGGRHETMPPQPMLNSAPTREMSWAGIRSTDWKVIRPYDWTDGFQELEAYHVAQDPAEVDPEPESAAPESLREQLEDFVARPAITAELTQDAQRTSGFDSEVEDRLQELGYLE
jgi:arylsulfatase A-like enzyme